MSGSAAASRMLQLGRSSLQQLIAGHRISACAAIAAARLGEHIPGSQFPDALALPVHRLWVYENNLIHPFDPQYFVGSPARHQSRFEARGDRIQIDDGDAHGEDYGSWDEYVEGFTDSDDDFDDSDDYSDYDSDEDGRNNKPRPRD